MKLDKVKLAVPLVRQPDFSAECGPAVVAMVLKYFKVSFDYEKLKKDMGLFEWGTVTPQLGLFLQKKGFKTEILTMHPGLFSLYSKFKTPGDLVTHFKKLKPKLKGEYDGIAVDYFIKYVQSGGKVRVKIPDEKDLHVQLKKGGLAIASITHWFLSKTDMPPRLSIHFNVVTGMDDKFVYVNDPDFGNDFGGKRKFKIKDYLYAIYASTPGGVDDASILLINKK